MAPNRKESNKKKVSAKEFERKIKIWSIVVPLVATFLSTLTALGVAYYASRSKVEYQIPIFDRLEVNKLSLQINELLDKFITTSDSDERKKIYLELGVLALEEARIMRKYNPDYPLRWPPHTNQAVTTYTKELIAEIKRIPDEYEKPYITIDLIILLVLVIVIIYCLVPDIVSARYKVSRD